MENNIVIPAETQKQIDQAENELQTVKSYVICNDQQYSGTADMLKSIKAKINTLETKRKDITSPMDSAKKAVMDLFRPALEKLEGAERMLKNKMMDYQHELDRKASAAQALLDEQARKDRAKLEARAEKAAAKGDTDKADDLQAQATAVVAPVVEAAKPKVAGVNTVTRWKFRIKDDKLIPREYLIPNEKVLQALATSSKGSLAIPGVEFYSETDINASRK